MKEDLSLWSQLSRALDVHQQSLIRKAGLFQQPLGKVPGGDTAVINAKAVARARQQGLPPQPSPLASSDSNKRKKGRSRTSRNKTPTTDPCLPNPSSPVVQPASAEGGPGHAGDARDVIIARKEHRSSTLGATCMASSKTARLGAKQVSEGTFRSTDIRYRTPELRPKSSQDKDRGDRPDSRASPKSKSAPSSSQGAPRASPPVPNRSLGAIPRKRDNSQQSSSRRDGDRDRGKERQVSPSLVSGLHSFQGSSELLKQHEGLAE